MTAFFLTIKKKSSKSILSLYYRANNYRQIRSRLTYCSKHFTNKTQIFLKGTDILSHLPKSYINGKNSNGCISEQFLSVSRHNSEHKTSRLGMRWCNMNNQKLNYF